jgi:hypothetical protein
MFHQSHPIEIHQEHHLEGSQVYGRVDPALPSPNGKFLFPSFFRFLPAAVPFSTEQRSLECVSSPCRRLTTF